MLEMKKSVESVAKYLGKMGEGISEIYQKCADSAASSRQSSLSNRSSLAYLLNNSSDSQRRYCLKCTLQYFLNNIILGNIILGKIFPCKICCLVCPKMCRKSLENWPTIKNVLPPPPPPKKKRLKREFSTYNNNLIGIGGVLA